MSPAGDSIVPCIAADSFHDWPHAPLADCHYGNERGRGGGAKCQMVVNYSSRGCTGSTPTNILPINNLLMFDDAIDDLGGKASDIVDSGEAAWWHYHTGIRIDRCRYTNVHVHIIQPIVVCLQVVWRPKQ